MVILISCDLTAFPSLQEYKGDDSAGDDALCISRTAIAPGDRVLLIDDLIATGGTLLAGVELVKAQKVKAKKGVRMTQTAAAVDLSRGLLIVD